MSGLVLGGMFLVAPVGRGLAGEGPAVLGRSLALPTVVCGGADIGGALRDGKERCRGFDWAEFEAERGIAG